MSITNLSVSGETYVGSGLWSLGQTAAPGSQATPPRLFLRQPPVFPQLRTAAGPLVTALDPQIIGEVQIAARVFTVWGSLQVFTSPTSGTNTLTNASLTRLGEPHPSGALPLFYEVQNADPLGAHAWLPPWDGEYQVFTDSTCATLIATRRSGEVIMIPAATTRSIFQQART